MPAVTACDPRHGLWTYAASNHVDQDEDDHSAAIDSWRASAHSRSPHSIRQQVSYPQPAQRRPFKRRKYANGGLVITLLSLLTLFVSKTSAAFVYSFENCLPDNYLNVVPPNEPLQWTPLWVEAKFDRSAPSHNLNVTFYGNVSGQATVGPYPAADSPTWTDPLDGFGKIVNISNETNIYTTLHTTYNVLTYTAFSPNLTAFCQTTSNTACPIGPRFHALNEPSQLPAFSVVHDFYSSFAFSTIITKVRVDSGDKGAQVIACVSANITPALGSTISNILAYLPVMILVFVAIAVVLAGTYSPWGTLDPFRWTTNYGRDEDLLRLVTPGFGDCLQYIQFIVLAGSLSLAYPGYYQPVVSQVGWSALMFNESFVSHGNGTANPVDGIYVTNGGYGLTRMSQLIGVSEAEDLWAGMVVWALVIILLVVVACQLGFFARWSLQRIANNPAQDLRSKNWPFTGGNLVRIVCNFFLLPIVSLSMFQLVMAASSPAIVVAFAVILLVALLMFAGWILRLIFRTKPRSHLFDDLPTVLLYGPLYNTYSDGAAPFALIPASLTFLKGVAIGAIQLSGIAQLVILAVCEVILILTLHAFRPFQSPTSMNAIHTVFAGVRLITVLLMVAFAPSLGVTEGTKGWIGYVILLLHGLVLVFGFFLNAIQTIIEISARLAGAGGGSTRGGLVKAFGVRQLSKRQGRLSHRHSQHSTTAMLADDGDAKSAQFGGRSRSLSASSAIMLNSHRASFPRVSSHLDRTMSGVTGEGIPAESEYSNLPAGGVGPAGPKRPDLSLKTEPADPYYRPPRQRRPTGDLMMPGAMSRDRSESNDWPIYATSPDLLDRRDPAAGTGSASPQQQIAPAPAYMRAREGSDANPDQNKDYAVREVDYYYGVRGPALSSQPTRKLKTGPADPVGPVSSATGWFRNIFGGPKKESGKGFEVVRSSRMPPPRDVEDEDDEVVRAPEEPYRDTPTPLQQEAYLPGERTRSNAADDRETDVEPSPVDSDDEDLGRSGDSAIPDRPPSLDPLDILGGGLGLPSRWSSRVSRQPSGKKPESEEVPIPLPAVPRKSSKRTASSEANALPQRATLSAILDSPGGSQPRTPEPPRVPFSRSRDGSRRPSAGAESFVSVEGEQAEGGARGRSRSGSISLHPPLSTADRPTSYGTVNQFRAISHPGNNAHAGSSAEVIESSPRRRGEED